MKIHKHITRLALGFLLALGVLTNASANEHKRVLIVGDSISAAYGLSVKSGWVTLLEARMKTAAPAYTVVNASISGETTAGGAARIAKLIATHKPTVVVIELGGNDALRGLPIAQTQANFVKMIQASQKSAARVVIVPMRLPPNFGGDYVQQFEALYPKLAKQFKTGMSAFILKDFADKPALFQADKIHPTAAAQPLMLDAVWPAIRAELK